MSVIETRLYSAFTSAPGNAPDFEKLEFEILNHVPAFTAQLECKPSPYDLNAPAKVGFQFDIALTGPENTELDSIVAAHDGQQLDRGVDVHAFTRLVPPTTSDNEAAGFNNGDFWIDRIFPGFPVVYQKEDEVGGVAQWVRRGFLLALGKIIGLVPRTNQPSDTSEVVITPGLCASKDATVIIAITSNLIIDLDVSGAGGLDTGSKAINTWYAIYMIRKDDGTVSAVFSTAYEPTGPTMPAGYTERRYIGDVLTDSDGDITDYRIYGDGNNLRYIWAQNRTSSPFRVKSAGSATSFQAISLAGVVPETATEVKLVVNNTNSPTLYMRESDVNGGIDQPSGTVRVGGDQTDNPSMGVDSEREIEYSMSSGGGSVYIDVVGYEIFR